MSKAKKILDKVKQGLKGVVKVVIWPFAAIGRLLVRGVSSLRKIQLRWVLPILALIALVSFLGFLYFDTQTLTEEEDITAFSREVEEKREEEAEPEPAVVEEVVEEVEEKREEEPEVIEETEEEETKEEEREHEPVLVMPEREEPDADVPVFSLGDLIRPIVGEIKIPYGWHFHEVFGDWRFNHGIDLDARPGTPVRAVWQGEVARVRQDDLLGTVITIDHGSDLRTKYGLVENVNVSTGQWVEKGETVGVVSRSPLFGESRLHFQLHRKGIPIDPGPYYRGWEG